MAATLTSRVGAVVTAYDEAHRRLVARLTAVTDEEAATVPATGGWTAAQIAEHVAAFDRTLARVVAGSLPVARPAPFCIYAIRERPRRGRASSSGSPRWLTKII